MRQGERALYYWIYPNFMINCYGGAMDTNLVIPRGVDRTEVIFDFYFADVSAAARAANLASIAISEQIQDEDVAICESVQRGLHSRAYGAGRLSVRREAGEHLFHRLLAQRSQARMTGLAHPVSKGRLLPVLGVGFGLAVTIGNTIGAGILARAGRNRRPSAGGVAVHGGLGRSAVSMRSSVRCNCPSLAR